MNSPNANSNPAQESVEASLAATTNPTLVPNRRIPAWLLSFLMHTLLLILLVLAFRTVSRGAAEVENRSGGIVLVKQVAEQTEYLSEGDTDATSNESNSADNPPPASPDTDLPPDLPGMQSSTTLVTGVGEDFTDSLPGAESMLEGPSTNKKVGGEVTTEVFGIKGTGSRFVYVFDRSASMEGFNAKPLIAAKQQLNRSLQSLGSIHQFQIIFYNDDTMFFDPNPGPPEMIFASDDLKKKAERFVNSVRGDRGTNHMRALQAALALGPDVVFLLTDAEGGFTSAELGMISRWNRSGAVINAIEFGVRSGPGSDQSLRRLAQENGGQYSFKNITSLQLKN